MDTAPDPGRGTRLASLLNRPVVLLATGLGLSAAAGSGFIAVVNHSMPPIRVAPLPGLYFLLAAIGTGMFAAFEQEMTRAVSRALALGHSEPQVIRHQVRNAAWVGVGTLALVCAASPFVTHHWMYGDWAVFAELLIGLAGIWASFLVRGVLSGRRQFRSYAITMVVEGLARLLPSIVLAALALGSTWSQGLVFALGPMVAAVSGLLVARAPIPYADALGATETAAANAPPAEAVQAQAVVDTAPENASAGNAAPDGSALDNTVLDTAPETANQAAARLARLTGGVLAGQVLMYAMPLVVTGRLTTDSKLAISVASAVGLTRLGLLILFPLQAPLLPRLTAAAALGRMAEVRRTTAALVAICVAAGIAGIVASGLVGPWVLTTVMGAKVRLSAVLLMELSLGTLFLLVANILQSALTALNRQQTVLFAWCLGVVTMFVVFAVPLGPLTTAAVASIAGPAATMALMALDVLRVTGGRPASARRDEVATHKGPAAAERGEPAPSSAHQANVR
ncbi:hypothetical protein KGA66_15350 [Actinocrinis puniceicyclus]|uniref:Membrane protein involved in the export of O-antigen and teichoic acid n=1 Tax=Actinocrinis puniceicyclus TaxID=977794 RepID=A0A8J8BCQ4_9ACTN|nr:hypothetical protein [Actinocrinis puniceicyclus]MBS2964433.1 hypothetical protein [Actinocrinis puniceicyclus]